jgi:hypothetical protein
MLVPLKLVDKEKKYFLINIDIDIEPAFAPRRRGRPAFSRTSEYQALILRRMLLALGDLSSVVPKITCHARNTGRIVAFD